MKMLIEKAYAVFDKCWHTFESSILKCTTTNE